MTQLPRHLPGQHLIDAYGNGGFRFGDMSHKGSILATPSGVFAWPVSDASGLQPENLALVLSGADPVEFLLLGTGERHVLPSATLREAFRAAGIGLDIMTTGAAARTYNVLVAERRKVGAALIAVA